MLIPVRQHGKQSTVCVSAIFETGHARMRMTQVKGKGLQAGRE